MDCLGGGLVMDGSMDSDEYWHIDGAVDFVKAGGYKVVVLQFPDDLLKESALVAKRLADKWKDADYEAEVFVLADSAYDSLSIDEVAASHVKADCIVHYGSASMTPATHTPCFFVFPTEGSSGIHSVDYIAKNIESWITETSKAVIIFLDHTLQHWWEEMSPILNEIQVPIPLVLAKTATRSVLPTGNDIREEDSSSVAPEAEEHVRDTKVIKIAGMQWKLPQNVEMEDCSCIWIGSEYSKTLFHLSLQFSKSTWVLLDPTAMEVQVGLPTRTLQLLRKRYFLVEKARNAQLIGILVSTLAVGGFLSVVKRIKQLAIQAGKKTYLVVIGKPAPEKLANFPEIEIFVMICDPPSMILDSKEYLAPIITPFEAQVAFSGKLMETNEYRYSMMDEVLPSQQAEPSPHFSLVDGSLHAISNDAPSVSDMAVVARGEHTIVSVEGAGVRSAADYFANKRNFKGMDPNVEDPAVGKVIAGRKGRAAGYSDEPS